MPVHVKYECKGGHEYLGCQFCDGGLYACTVCRGFEGSLPTDCPGVKMTEQQETDVYAGKTDYREGQGWITPDGFGTSMGDSSVRAAVYQLGRHIHDRSWEEYEKNGKTPKMEQLYDLAEELMVWPGLQKDNKP